MRGEVILEFLSHGTSVTRGPFAGMCTVIPDLGVCSPLVEPSKVDTAEEASGEGAEGPGLAQTQRVGLQSERWLDRRLSSALRHLFIYLFFSTRRTGRHTLHHLT